MLKHYFDANHSDYFGRKKSFFNKYYIDYSLKEITTANKLTNDEIKIIDNAKMKYTGILCINYFLFFYTCRRIYKKGLQDFIIDIENRNFINNFFFNSIISIVMMIFVYKQAQIFYYNDLKYLIMKYNKLNKDQYYNAELNRQIYNLYENDLKDKNLK